MKSRWAAALLLVPLAAALALSGRNATAQSDSQSILNRLDALTTQLANLRGELGDMQRVVYQGDKPPDPPPLEASGTGRQRLVVLESKVDAFDERLRDVNGRFDEVVHMIGVLESRIDKLVADIDFRLGSIESGGAPVATSGGQDQFDQQSASAAGGATQSRPAGQGYQPSEAPQVLGTIPASEGDTELTSVAPEPSTANGTGPAGSTPDDQYSYAFSLLRQAQFDDAETAFSQFIAENPGHPRVENAAYWFAETFYARRMFGEAKRIYARNLLDYPQGEKAPDNMVKLGLSLVNLQRFDEACQTFNKLANDYPEMPVNVRQASDRGRALAGCS